MFPSAAELLGTFLRGFDMTHSRLSAMALRILASLVASLISMGQILPALAADQASPLPSELDLSSTTKSVRAPGTLVAPVVITQGQSSHTVTATSMLTPAQAVAVAQILETGRQSLTLGVMGNASGGSMTLTSTQNLNFLKVPSGVTVIGDFANTNSISVRGNITNSGTIFAQTANPNFTNLIMNMVNLTNTNSGLILNTLPGLNLSLVATESIFNAGRITSAGNLNLIAGQIQNSNPVGLTTPLLAANGHVNIATANLLNAGTIGALGNINIVQQIMRNSELIQTASQVPFNMLPASTLSAANSSLIQTTLGTLFAVNGSISLDSYSQSPVNRAVISGGELRSQLVYINTGLGQLEMNVGRVTGTINMEAGSVFLSATTPVLELGFIKVPGNMLFVSTGDLTAAALPATGGVLSLISGGSIKLIGQDYTARTAKGQGLQMNLVAGAAFKDPALKLPVEVVGPSSTGGDIFLLNSTLDSSSTGTASLSGGRIFLTAFRNVAGTNGGSIDLNGSSLLTNASATGAKAGDVIIYAPRDIKLNNISMLSPGGTLQPRLNVVAAQPTGSLVVVPAGITAGGLKPVPTLTGTIGQYANAQILASAGIVNWFANEIIMANNGTVINVSPGANVRGGNGGTVNLRATDTITLAGSILANGSVGSSGLSGTTEGSAGTAGSDGGGGGLILLTAGKSVRASDTTSTSVVLQALGRNGGAGGSGAAGSATVRNGAAGGSGGAGGSAGIIQVNAADIDLGKALLHVSAGSGGVGGYGGRGLTGQVIAGAGGAGGAGGNGGNGGRIVLRATTISSTPTIVAIAGNGGNGNLGGLGGSTATADQSGYGAAGGNGGAGGSGGIGGQVTLVTSGQLTLTNAIVARGGSGGASAIGRDGGTGFAGGGDGGASLAAGAGGGGGVVRIASSGGINFASAPLDVRGGNGGASASGGRGGDGRQNGALAGDGGNAGQAGNGGAGGAVSMVANGSAGLTPIPGHSLRIVASGGDSGLNSGNGGNSGTDPANPDSSTPRLSPAARGGSGGKGSDLGAGGNGGIIAIQAAAGALQTGSSQSGYITANGGNSVSASADTAGGAGGSGGGIRYDGHHGAGGAGGNGSWSGSGGSITLTSAQSLTVFGEVQALGGTAVGGAAGAGGAGEVSSPNLVVPGGAGGNGGKGSAGGAGGLVLLSSARAQITVNSPLNVSGGSGGAGGESGTPGDGVTDNNGGNGGVGGAGGNSGRIVVTAAAGAVTLNAPIVANGGSGGDGGGTISGYNYYGSGDGGAGASGGRGGSSLSIRISGLSIVNTATITATGAIGGTGGSGAQGGSGGLLVGPFSLHPGYDCDGGDGGSGGAGGAGGAGGVITFDALGGGITSKAVIIADGGNGANNGPGAGGGSGADGHRGGDGGNSQAAGLGGNAGSIIAKASGQIALTSIQANGGHGGESPYHMGTGGSSQTSSANGFGIGGNGGNAGASGAGGHGGAISVVSSGGSIVSAQPQGYGLFANGGAGGYASAEGGWGGQSDLNQPTVGGNGGNASSSGSGGGGGYISLTAAGSISNSAGFTAEVSATGGHGGDTYNGNGNGGWGGAGGGLSGEAGNSGAGGAGGRITVVAQSILSFSGIDVSGGTGGLANSWAYPSGTANLRGGVTPPGVNGGNAGNGGNGGSVVVRALDGSITFAGGTHSDIRASGGDGGTQGLSAQGGDAGASFGTMGSPGGNAGVTGNGGKGGVVSIIALHNVAADNDISVSGRIWVTGGNAGGIQSNEYRSGGLGGAGGDVLSAANGRATGSDGGTGGQGSPTGSGGHGGSIVIANSTGRIMLSDLFAFGGSAHGQAGTGGSGGHSITFGGNAGDGGNGGHGGNGGQVTVLNKSGLASASSINANGGDGGQGGMGGAGGKVLHPDRDVYAPGDPYGPNDGRGGYGGNGGNGGNGGSVRVMPALKSVTTVQGGIGGAGGGFGPGITQWWDLPPTNGQAGVSGIPGNVVMQDDDDQSSSDKCLHKQEHGRHQIASDTESSALKPVAFVQSITAVTDRQLTSENVLLHARNENITAFVGRATVHIARGAAVYIASEGKDVCFMNMHDNKTGDVTVHADGQAFVLCVGQKLVLTKANLLELTNRTAIPRLPYRCLNEHKLAHDQRAYLSDFPLMQAMATLDTVRQLKSSTQKQERNLYGTLLKTAAALQISTIQRGRFTADP